MEKLIYRALCLFVVAGMFWLAGCEEEESRHTICPPGPGTVRSLQILMGDTTLESLPGDTVSTNVTVIARDGNGMVVPNERVVVTLENPLLGWLEYVDPVRRDTTNAQGQVQFIFRSFGQYGANAILAQAAGGMSARQRFVIQEDQHTVRDFIVQTHWVENSIFLAGDTAVAVIRVFASGYGGLGIPGVDVVAELIQNSAGHLELMYPEQGNFTNERGEIEFYYWTMTAGRDSFAIFHHDTLVAGGELVTLSYEPDVSLLAIPAELDLSSQGDSVQLILNLTYENYFRGIRDSVLSVWVSGGELAQNPLPPTDIGGTAWTWWHFNQTPSTYRAAVNYHGYTDSVTVQVTQ